MKKNIREKWGNERSTCKPQRRMSYVINASQAKWFGFQPKFVWDDFVIEHTTVARKIKSATFPYFMEIEESESKIKIESQKILKEEKINVAAFAARSKMKREEGKQLATREMMKEREAQVIVLDEEEGEEGEGGEKRSREDEKEEARKRRRQFVENAREVEKEREEREGIKEKMEELERRMERTIMEMDWDKEDEDVKLLGRIYEEIFEGTEYAFPAYITKILEMYSKVKEEKEKYRKQVEDLQKELRECQADRDNWRKKYMIVVKSVDDVEKA